VFSLLSLILLGFFLGMRHATDPDHVIAVTTIVSRHRTIRGASVIGLAWGLGHTATILGVGGAIVLLGWVIPPRVELGLELGVAAMLVLLGVANLRRAPAQPDDTQPAAALLTRPLAIGVVHGLAGSAAATLLVLTVIQEPAWALAYLALFGAGTIAGMMLITVLVAVPFAATGGREHRVHPRLRLGASLLSIGFGLFLAYRVGVVDGLFLG
jgi:high-affinity nickel-transport protein